MYPLDLFLGQKFTAAREKLMGPPGGMDPFLFWVLALPVVSAEPIYLRERDLSYFRVEDWPKDVRLTMSCILFDGDIPCLYSISVPSSQSDSLPPAAPGGCEPSAPTPPNEDFSGGVVPPIPLSLGLLSLVDFVSRTTGSGVGLVRKAPVPGSTVKTDLRTGRGIRYRITKFPQDASDLLYWVERSESGRSRGSLGGSFNML